MARLNVYMRDNLIVNIIKSHIGSENGISGTEICKMLSAEGFSLKKTQLRNSVEKIRKERCLPIWYEKSCGYFWLNKAEEVKRAIAKLQATRNTLQDTIDLLQRFTFEGEGGNNG